MENYAVCVAVTVLTACAANPIDNIDVGKTSKVVVVNKATAAKVDTKTQQTVVASRRVTQQRKRQPVLAKKTVIPKVVKTAMPKKIVKKKPPVILAKVAQNPVVRQQSRIIPKPVIRPMLKKLQPRVVRAASKIIPKPVLKQAVKKPRILPQHRKAAIRKPTVIAAAVQHRLPRIDPDKSFGYALSNAAIERTEHNVRYDGSYVKIGYPWGDVPKSIGVCTDVVIRAYRKLGIDLQQEVHNDIKKDFYAYPTLKRWGLTKPDPNIDHRRVYNLQAFFKRHKAELPQSRNPKDYKPGDLVTWMIGPSFPHIGVVVNKPSKADPNRLMISHNIGYGPQVEDILFRFPMTGHYRYTPKNKQVKPELHFAKTPAPGSKQRNNSMSYDDLLKASRYLIGGDKRADQKKNTPLLQVKQVKPKQINLAQLDIAALNALLKY